MEKDIVEGKIGNVGAYDVEFKGGKLVGKIGVAHELVPGVKVSGDLALEIDAKVIKEAAKKAIPGQVDDVILDAVFNPLLGA